MGVKLRATIGRVWAENILCWFLMPLYKRVAKKKVQKGEGECISVSSVSTFLCYGAVVMALVKTVKGRIKRQKKDEH